MEESVKKPNPKLDFENVEHVNEIVREAVRQALGRHKVMKNPVPSWDGEKVEMVQPEDLPEPDKA